jgi:hypothetical protein
MAMSTLFPMSSPLSLLVVATPSIRNAMSVLGITRVIELCSNIQMGRTTTGRVVAPMQDMQSIRDRAMGQYPCDTMGLALVLSIYGSMETSISAPLSTFWPFPTTIIFKGGTNNRPKKLGNIGRFWAVSATWIRHHTLLGKSGLGECVATGPKKPSCPAVHDTAVSHRPYYSI